MGSAFISVHGACLYQQRRVQRALSSHLWCGRDSFGICVPENPQEAAVGIFTVGGSMLRAGVLYQLVSGAALGCPLVGLQRALYEPERQNMPGGGIGFRVGRDGPGLPAFAAL